MKKNDDGVVRIRLLNGRKIDVDPNLRQIRHLTENEIQAIKNGVIKADSRGDCSDGPFKVKMCCKGYI